MMPTPKILIIGADPAALLMAWQSVSKGYPTTLLAPNDPEMLSENPVWRELALPDFTDPQGSQKLTQTWLNFQGEVGASFEKIEEWVSKIPAYLGFLQRLGAGFSYQADGLLQLIQLCKRSETSGTQLNSPLTPVLARVVRSLLQTNLLTLKLRHLPLDLVQHFSGVVCGLTYQDRISGDIVAEEFTQIFVSGFSLCPLYTKNSLPAWLTPLFASALKLGLDFSHSQNIAFAAPKKNWPPVSVLQKKQPTEDDFLGDPVWTLGGYVHKSAGVSTLAGIGVVGESVAGMHGTELFLGSVPWISLMELENVWKNFQPREFPLKDVDSILRTACQKEQNDLHYRLDLRGPENPFLLHEELVAQMRHLKMDGFSPDVCNKTLDFLKTLRLRAERVSVHDKIQTANLLSETTKNLWAEIEVAQKIVQDVLRSDKSLPLHVVGKS